jgi:hypothetical protein
LGNWVWAEHRSVSTSAFVDRPPGIAKGLLFACLNQSLSADLCMDKFNLPSSMRLKLQILAAAFLPMLLLGLWLGSKGFW